MPVRDGQLLAVALVLPREAQGAPPSVVRAGAPCAPITSRSSVATSNLWPVQSEHGHGRHRPLHVQCKYNICKYISNKACDVVIINMCADLAPASEGPRAALSP